MHFPLALAKTNPGAVAAAAAADAAAAAAKKQTMREETRSRRLKQQTNNNVTISELIKKKFLALLAHLSCWVFHATPSGEILIYKFEFLDLGRNKLVLHLRSGQKLERGKGEWLPHR